MNKQVHRYADIKAKIIKAVDTIADPVRETISPKGRDVMFEDDKGKISSTNDGVTIAKAISVKDPIENAIIEALKGAALKTNNEAGDGTSTTILLSSILVKEGLRLIDSGWNPMDVRRQYDKFGEEILTRLKKKAIPIKNDRELKDIARISANSDDDVAQNVVKAIKAVGVDGMVFLDQNNKVDTEVEEQIGFNIESGMFAPELRNGPKAFTAQYKSVPVLVTDKRIYYPEEAETILKTVMLEGHKQVVVVARDFIGQAINVFIANHTKGVCSVLLVKDPNATDKDCETLHDLATYLGTKVVTEKEGSLVDNLQMSDFAIADRAFSDGIRTIIATPKKKNKAVLERIEAIKSELKKDKDNDALKKRVASLTSGMVTIRVGGPTMMEVIERIYRYEDAVNATRAAMRDGYLVGGGVSLAEIMWDMESLFKDSDIRRVFYKLCTGNITQIVENCGGHADSVLNTIEYSNVSAKGKRWTLGYNANTGEIEDLLKSGVIDPYKVTEMAVRNSISVASRIISSGYLIVHEDVVEEK